jgi:tRNA U-34 5-methylaminomethyl-2-thiouridine biosynthesis protein MnmC
VINNKTHKQNIYDYIIIGAGIAGTSVAYELNKHTNNILVIEKGDSVAVKASGVAGGFLSPLLGKPNDFKQLVNDAFRYSVDFYKKNTPNSINNCGTLRIPKDDIDRQKFQTYIPFIDFDYEIQDDELFVKNGSIVDTKKVCEELINGIDIQYNTDIKHIKKKDNIWILNDTYYTKNLIVTTGSSLDLIDEFYLNIRAIWGQRIDISTSTPTTYNYHKECSVSVSSAIDEKTYKISIGATHHRFVNEQKISTSDTQDLLKKAQDILNLKDIKVLNEYAGARSASVDYFPMVGKIIDANKTIELFPYLKYGTNVEENRFKYYDNLYMVNGLGGRGFVLAPYLAKQLVDLLIHDKALVKNITINRLFKRAVKKLG